MTVVSYRFPTAIVPVTVMTPTAARQAPTDVPFHPTYNGAVLFRNTFDGELPAGDYPKVNVSSPFHLHKHTCRYTASSTSSCSLRMRYLARPGRIFATNTLRNSYLFRCASS